MNQVSIIVPVYNCEEYIEACIESILSQTYSAWELVLVDDGSQDKSGVICDKYGSLDNRIKVFHKTNGGVSSARNYGIRVSTSNWICFIDSDDTINKDYLSFLLSNINMSPGIDFSICGYKNFYENSIAESVNDIHTIKENTITSDIPEFIRLGEQANLLNSPVSKIFSRDIIRKNGILFDKSISYGEDHIFVLEYLKYVKIVSISSYVGYNYIHHITESLTSPWKNTIKYLQYVEKLSVSYNDLNLVLESDIFRNTYHQSLHEHIVRALFYILNSKGVDKTTCFCKLYDLNKIVSDANPSSFFYKMIFSGLKLHPKMSFIVVLFLCKIKRLLKLL